MKSYTEVLIIVFLIILFLLIYLFNSIVITIYPGKAGVLFRRFPGTGTVLTRSYPEGLNVILPWNKMYIYDARIQEFKQHVDVLSQNGLTIQVTVSVRYHLLKDRVQVLHQKVGPEFERKVIIPSTISSVREVIGSYKPEELYTTARHLIQDEIIVEAVEETGRLPIIYDDIIVEEIKLPLLINSAIEAKLKQQQQYLEYEFKLKREEAERKRKEIEAAGIKKYQEIVSKSLSSQLLKWKGIQATIELAKSNNSKVVVIGNSGDGLPIILNAETETPKTEATVPETQDTTQTER